MKTFCRNCGTDTKGEKTCPKCGNINEFDNNDSLIDKVKNFDYKGTAEALKEKASDVAGKAKEYDYKGKAKEVSEAVKNYDYKTEAENIKKGGVMYFWNAHKKIAIGIIAALAIVLVLFLFSDNSHWARRSLDDFHVTLEEVIEIEKSMSDSGEPERNGVSLNYHGVDFLGYKAELSYVSNNEGTEILMTYTVNNVELEEILKKIEKKLGKVSPKEDIVPNYIWIKDGYKYNLVYTPDNSQAIFVVAAAE